MEKEKCPWGGECQDCKYDVSDCGYDVTVNPWKQTLVDKQVRTHYAQEEKETYCLS